MATKKNKLQMEMNAKASATFLPGYFRTEPNKKFLAATIDQMISAGEVEKVNAFIGRKNTKIFSASDVYLPDVSATREAYQFEPAVVIRDDLNKVEFFKDYNDYINQLQYFAGQTINHDAANSQEFYSWNPHIDWDKLVNYREYYWLPNGPMAIKVQGQSTAVTSTYSVSVVNDGDNWAYVFSPDGKTRNPSLKLYRGQTYRFEIDCPGHPMAFSTTRSFVPAESILVQVGSSIGQGGEFDVKVFDEIAFDLDGWVESSATVTPPAGQAAYTVWKDGVASDTVYVEKGIVEFTVPHNAPNILYYVSKNSINTSGMFKVYNATEATAIDVTTEIIGKTSYTTSAGVVLSNGMKLSFAGNVTPEKYATGYWYVEGVGSSIVLVAERDLETPAIFTADDVINFDSEEFDAQGYDVNSNYPGQKDYITVNRASPDRNDWARYNRWFNRQVIETSAAFNNQPVTVDQAARAIRPIIEFTAGLQLFNHGRVAKANVDVVDVYTTDVFSTIEGSLGYNIDGVQLVAGMRVLFVADQDRRVNGRIFEVDVIKHAGTSRIALIPAADTDPIAGETVLVTSGAEYRGKMFHYTGQEWIKAQEKAAINQLPKFDVFDRNGTSFADQTVYLGSTFAGCTVFQYKAGATIDTELGFGVQYKNVGNIGDLLFDFTLHTDTFEYYDLQARKEVTLDSGFLHSTEATGTTKVSNGWTKAAARSTQPVVTQFVATTLLNFIPVDVYDNSALLADLTVKVWVNNIRQTDLDFTVYRQDKMAYIQLYKDLTPGDAVLIETRSAAIKNDNGFYKFPLNLESNPLNRSLTDITLGEVVNHAQTIADNAYGYSGVTPGASNLRDLGNLASYGTKVIQHSSPLAVAALHITSKEFNVVKAIQSAKEDYSKFKRNFLRVATDYGFDGLTRVHFDKVMLEVMKETSKDSLYYLSDMVPYGNEQIVRHTVIDSGFTDYPVAFDFNLTGLSAKAVLVYHNDTLLVHGTEYEFTAENFVTVKVPLEKNDTIDVVHYASTNGSCVPATPTKLGLFPAFEPKLYLDTTYQEPVWVVQGHDGSITVAFGDYRDELLLELERRIYNNIKVQYNPALFNVHDYLPGFYRNNQATATRLNTAMQQDFLRWAALVGSDYTKNEFYDRNNPFTFNYSKCTDSNGVQLPGFWRGIFKYYYDTDRPHIAPWEMLGFSVMPAWWEEVYGPAPYTSNNLVLWQDLAAGNVCEPGAAVVQRPQYARPDLLSRLPVDENGNLRIPTEANLLRGYISVEVDHRFVFGDVAPVEAAFRRGSEYPFAFISALTSLFPAGVFAVLFDRSRQEIDAAGQIVYNTGVTQCRFAAAEIVTPSVVTDTVETRTSGLVNYVVDYIAKTGSSKIADYRAALRKLDVKMASKLGGFASKEKLRLLLDSRSPLNKSNVFVPNENYSIFLNTSSPVQSITYSGVIVEKRETGFVIKGYSNSAPQFKWYEPAETASDPVINVGGISEPYVTWDNDRLYNKGTIVRHDDQYYVTTTTHRSTSSFELKYYSKLMDLPVVGGRQIIIRKNFRSRVKTLHYGTELQTIQDVVDFLLGYGRYLESVGFTFNYFNSALNTVIDWSTAAKEFAFWTTQNWAAGAVISLSPAADELVFEQQYAVVDNVLDKFYEYSVLKENGVALDPALVSTHRQGGEFVARPKNTADGIYHMVLNLVQKEHALVLDDTTIFNDVIYDQTQGYHLERIKLLGYRTAEWSGGFDIPGFVYDTGVVREWKPWTDYALGDAVKYKEFYYGAKKTIAGTAEFNFSDWNKLNEKPEAHLLPNWDYRADQFLDFYDLESDSFDATQQKFAQHLSGYQKRQYLDSIINDDVAQYKFYQGMIQEKGAKNSLSKLFDALNSANGDSLEFYEEWAIRLGQYGATESFAEVEYKLAESGFLVNPQPFELVAQMPVTSDDFVYRITPADTYLKPATYSHAPFPLKKIVPTFVRTAGYVNKEDVDFIVSTAADLEMLDQAKLVAGNTIWVGTFDSSWTVLRYTLAVSGIKSVSVVAGNLQIELHWATKNTFNAGEYISLVDLSDKVNAIAKVVAVTDQTVTVPLPDGVSAADVANLNTYDAALIFKFVPVRFNAVADLSAANVKWKPTDKVWVDNYGSWTVYNNVAATTYAEVREDSEQFARTFAVSKNNAALAVADRALVKYYERDALNSNNWAFVADLSYTDATFAQAASFGNAVGLNDNGDTLVITGGTSQLAIFKKMSARYFEFVAVVGVPGLDASSVAIKVVGDIAAVVSHNILAFVNLRTHSVKVYDAQDNISKFDVSANFTSILSLVTGEVKVVAFDAAFNATSTVTTGVVGQSLSVAISPDATVVAVGGPYVDSTLTDVGNVTVYHYAPTGLTKVAELECPHLREGYKFGTSLAFDRTGTHLIVTSAGGDVTVDLTWSDRTTFDFNTTAFVELFSDVGAVHVFDLLDKVWVRATDLEVTTPATHHYGNHVVVTDRVYIGDSDVNGKVYEFAALTNAWAVSASAEPKVDLQKIKSVFLYNTRTNSIVRYLDFVDVTAGKIAGPAEQEISYKTYYDPASYSIGIEEVVVDPSQAWTTAGVGRLWWDLNSARFVESNQGNVLFKANTWNETFLNDRVVVYEWVESEWLPSEWDALADTEEGLALGISGKSKYGDLAYSYNQRYDSVSKTFKYIYYFWVGNKSTVPGIATRKLSAADVADMITDPKSKGLQYATLLGANQFALVNCTELMADSDIAINFRYWVVDNKDTNIHSHYQLVAEGNPDSVVNPYIQKKWFDSLVGYDVQGNEVPDPALPAKVKYGVLNSPRQSMFINRQEAVKQVVERINSVLLATSVVDKMDLELLSTKEEPPHESLGAYDKVVETVADLRFIGTAQLKQASVKIGEIVNGSIKSVVVVEPGIGYSVAPEVVISGVGTGAVLRSTIDSNGSVVAVSVISEGSGYTNTTTATVRPYTVLVSADETAAGKWATYVYSARAWRRTKIQTFDTTKYWKFVDWYADGYNQFTRIDYVVDFAYEILAKDVSIGQVVKVNHEGSAGWVLLEKIDNRPGIDIAANFKTIARQNGTIQFLSGLYDYTVNHIGYDGLVYDGQFYDAQPKEELRVILDCIKENVFVDSLAVEFNKLFFASLRYVFSEQLFVDWAFKTSLVTAKHNLGALEQKKTYQPDTLDSYSQYINEVKPYRSKVREFVSSFEQLEPASMTVSDFDLPVRVSQNELIPFAVKVDQTGSVAYDSAEIFNAPYSSWYTNVGYSVVEITVVDSGANYITAPTVEIVGPSAEQATARAYIARGKVSKVVVETAGAGYLVTPTVTLVGGTQDPTNSARAVAVLGNSVVRTFNVGMKFDRVSSKSSINDVVVTETITAPGGVASFALKWPVDLANGKKTVIVDNEEKLSSEFSLRNVNGTAVLSFSSPSLVPGGSTITVTYTKDITTMSAADRVTHYYKPTAGMPGADLGFVMDGVDYGGVEVKGLKFDNGAGWDASPWVTSVWDSYDSRYVDYTIQSDGSTRSFDLPYVPELGEVITVYVNGTRIDDVNFGTSSPLVNKAAIMKSFVGDGVTSTVVLPESAVLTGDRTYNSTFDTIVFRKIDSDGSQHSPDIDTEISGGDLAYRTATGITASEIIVSGDGFVTPNTSYAPEEVVPGHVSDAVRITVYDVPSAPAPVLVSRHYVSAGEQSFKIGHLPLSSDSVFVKVNNSIKAEGVSYTINTQTASVDFVQPVPPGNDVAIISPAKGGEQVLDFGVVPMQAEQSVIETASRWDVNGVSTLVTVNSAAVPATPFKNAAGNISLRLMVPAQQGDVAEYVVSAGNETGINRVSRQEVIHNGVDSQYTLAIARTSYGPLSASTIVELEGKVLVPSSFFYFKVEGTARTYIINPVEFPLNSVDSTDINVYLNGKKLAISRDYSWLSATNELKVKRGVAKAGDRLVVEVITNAEYLITQSNGRDVLTLTANYQAGAKLVVTSFIDSNEVAMERVQPTVANVPASAVDRYRYVQQTSNLFTLSRPAIGAEYVWVSVNKVLLTPEVDYILNGSMQQVQLTGETRLNESDVVDIMLFSNKVAKAPFGFSIFKDMLNQVSYQRLDNAASTVLAGDLRYFDTEMVVVDGSKLFAPTRTTPGAVVIAGERIEYRTKNGNVLGNLRRGTLGTGVSEVVSAGTQVLDFNKVQHVPYKDDSVTETFVSTGVSNVVYNGVEMFKLVPTSVTPRATVLDEWFRETIPAEFGQCDNIEVFVGGIRLRKAPVTTFDQNVAPASPAGDVQHQAEFAVNAAGEILLPVVPPAGVRVVVQQRIGRTWVHPGNTLASSQTSQAKFIRATSADLPR